MIEKKAPVGVFFVFEKLQASPLWWQALTPALSQGERG